jgi:hypothetical protein
VCSDRRPRTSKREPGAIAVDDLPRETSADVSIKAVSAGYVDGVEGPVPLHDVMFAELP